MPSSFEASREWFPARRGLTLLTPICDTPPANSRLGSTVMEIRRSLIYPYLKRA